jgi:uncharacterized protein (DUF2126 family)
MTASRHEHAAAADRVAAVLARHGVRLTIGGEPTFVPVEPDGAEWNHAAVGPTKLRYARAIADRLLADALPGGVAFFSPGKLYPGELNPRWAIWLVGGRDGRPVFARAGNGAATPQSLARFREALPAALGIEPAAAGHWRQMRDEVSDSDADDSETWALVLDHADDRWQLFAWPPEANRLTEADGPAGLRLPLQLLPDGVPRRAIVLERTADRLAIFLPPLLQHPFIELLAAVEQALGLAGIGRIELQGPVPKDDAGRWIVVGLSADPGVLEINLPACHGWIEYDHWLRAVTDAAESAGLRSWREPRNAPPEDSGGGNHLLWGGPTLDENPFFTRPDWVASILRYWQRHPALSYCFIGKYVGTHSQAPRADESGCELHDLDWAWEQLASLPAGDNRWQIAETLRHLQADITGNAHRTEISFDKFWNPALPAGGCGLIEFRAICSLPVAEWSSGVALLWSALAAWLLDHPCRGPARDFGRSLHDRCLLPSFLWNDLAGVLAELRAAGFALDESLYREIWEWRFPPLLDFVDGDARLTVRQAAEPWPLLSDASVASATSRFIDTSLHRLECVANTAFVTRWQVRVANRPLPLKPVPSTPGGQDGGSGAACQWIAGLRYRRTQLQPSLHPGIAAQMPLGLSLVEGRRGHDFVLEEGVAGFQRRPFSHVPPPGPFCRPIRPDEITCDLRVADRDAGALAGNP